MRALKNLLKPNSKSDTYVMHRMQTNNMRARLKFLDLKASIAFLKLQSSVKYHCVQADQWTFLRHPYKIHNFY